ncbi:hypothetical protein Acor_46490 [Acrocarpospora corrugata]|uniref:FMN-dependent dehydrogenase domain-containing protein n=1 Tax=Acrocarpospora corrugata TaxID=35763 RepID=A0A5M3W5P2_9ACTN|nr:hypothetical protein Acor_46490 [Acrocarpospora corrugata]
MSSQFGDYQNEIYGNGLRGVVPGLPMTFAELEARAEATLPPSVWSYVAGGAGDEHTQLPMSPPSSAGVSSPGCPWEPYGVSCRWSCSA